MRKYYLTAFLLFVFIGVKAQQWQWVRNIALPSLEIHSAAMKDNRIVLLSSYNNSEVYLSICDTTGQLLQTDTLCGSLDHKAMAMDAQGNITVAGTFYDTLRLKDTMICSQANNLYFLQFDQQLHLQSARWFALQNAYVSLTDISFDPQGDLITLINFDQPITLFNHTFTPVEKDIVLLRTSPAGQLLWYDQLNGGLVSLKVHFTDANEMIMYGGISTTLDYDTVHHVNGSLIDGFVIKYDASYNYKWIRYTEFLGYSENDIDSDADGNIFHSSYGWANHSGSAGVIKYDPDYNKLWTDPHPGNAYGEYFHAMDIYESQGDLYYVYTHHEGFNPGISDDDSTNTFLVKLDSAGNTVWQTKLSSTSQWTHGAIMAEDGHGSIYLFGGYADTLFIGPLTQRANGYSGFIAKLNETVSTGISPPGITSRMQLSPNPAKNQVTIEIPGRPLNTTLLHLYSTEGKCVYTTALNGNRSTIQLPTGLHGIYLVEVVSGNDRVMKKLVVK